MNASELATSPRPIRILAASGLVAALIVVFVTTGPSPEIKASGTIRRFGGVCLELEKWQLFGWSVIGHTHTVANTQEGVWHPPTDSPPCAVVPEQIYLIRPPFDAPNGTYRICGLAEDHACVEFRRVPFESTPGP